MRFNSTELANVIDHTLLKPDATAVAIDRLCDEAIQLGFVAVCVQPCWAERCVRRLYGSPVSVATVIGFPHGANTTQAKAAEAYEAAEFGAHELDMVVNVGWVKSGMWDDVRTDIDAVVQAGKTFNADTKVILECAFLTDDEKHRGAGLAAEAGAAFVKTSTGYGSHGATIQDVRLLRSVVLDNCGVKAAGGIRDLDTALAMLDAGATRIGTSSGKAILAELRERAAALR